MKEETKRETPMVTIAEAHRRSGLSRDRIYEAIHTGEFGCIKCGRKYMIYYPGFEKWLAESRLERSNNESI